MISKRARPANRQVRPATSVPRTSDQRPSALIGMASQGRAFEPSGRSRRFTCICAVSLIFSELGEARADFASAYRDLGWVVAHEGGLPHRSEDRKR